MFRIAACLAGGIAAAFVAVLSGSLIGEAEIFAPNRLVAEAHSLPLPLPDRSGKGDRLRAAPPANAVQEQKQVAVIEVIGVRDPAIVYRDREGNVLFRTDPVSNVTVVVKNLVLPEVTVRESARSAVDRLPLEAPRLPNSTTPELVGCEPVVSPFTNPKQPPIIGRCLSDAGTRGKFSALR